MSEKLVSAGHPQCPYISGMLVGDFACKKCSYFIGSHGESTINCNFAERNPKLLSYKIISSRPNERGEEVSDTECPYYLMHHIGVDCKECNFCKSTNTEANHGTVLCMHPRVDISIAQATESKPAGPPYTDSDFWLPARLVQVIQTLDADSPNIALRFLFTIPSNPETRSTGELLRTFKSEAALLDYCQNIKLGTMHNAHFRLVGDKRDTPLKLELAYVITNDDFKLEGNR